MTRGKRNGSGQLAVPGRPLFRFLSPVSREHVTTGKAQQLTPCLDRGPGPSSKVLHPRQRPRRRGPGAPVAPPVAAFHRLRFCRSHRKTRLRGSPGGRAGGRGRTRFGSQRGPDEPGRGRRRPGSCSGRRRSPSWGARARPARCCPPPTRRAWGCWRGRCPTCRRSRRTGACSLGRGQGCVSPGCLSQGRRTRRCPESQRREAGRPVRRPQTTAPRPARRSLTHSPGVSSGRRLLERAVHEHPHRHTGSQGCAGRGPSARPCGSRGR